MTTPPRHYYKKFKYTRNKDRIIQTKALEPVKFKMFEAVHNIRWDEFKYNGRVSLPLADESDDIEDESMYEVVQVVAKAPEYPPHIFGGAVYELLNMKFPDKDLYDYMDITGDIDVRITSPQLISVNGIESDIEKYMLYERDHLKNINHLTYSYLLWLSSELNEHIIPVLADIPMEQCLPNPKALHVIDVYNNNTAYIVIVDEGSMIKVQLDVKIKGMKEKDHIIEFVLLVNGDDTSITHVKHHNPFKDKITPIHVKGLVFNIENIISLVNGNLSGMYERINYIHLENYKHKMYNHVSRLQYLNKIHNKFYKMHNPIVLKSDKFISRYIISVFSIIQYIEEHDVCDFLYLDKSCNEYNKYNMIRSLTYNFINNIKKLKSHLGPKDITNVRIYKINNIMVKGFKFKRVNNKDYIKQFTDRYYHPVPRPSISKPKSAPKSKTKTVSKSKTVSRPKSAPTIMLSKPFRKSATLKKYPITFTSKKSTATKKSAAATKKSAAATKKSATATKKSAAAAAND